MGGIEGRFFGEKPPKHFNFHPMIHADSAEHTVFYNCIIIAPLDLPKHETIIDYFSVMVPFFHFVVMVLMTTVVLSFEKIMVAPSDVIHATT